MAYTNSVETVSSRSRRGTTFTRGLMWAGIASSSFAARPLRLSLAEDAGLADLRAPARLLVLTLAIGDGVGGSARWIAIGPLTFQFSELAKILMIIVLAATCAAARRSTRCDDPGACVLVGPPLVLVMLQPDLGPSLCSPRSWPGCSGCRARA
jgi:cell division protein FtsW (lipid II flippase)